MIIMENEDNKKMHEIFKIVSIFRKILILKKNINMNSTSSSIWISTGNGNIKTFEMQENENIGVVIYVS